ncbi:APC family permease [Mycobacteroides sp. LB1]|uniref:APC family permease n=1 Tax=Mycobacteroides sp. LB1 TaxID=2750814 RepID=UPI001C5D2F7A
MDPEISPVRDPGASRPSRMPKVLGPVDSAVIAMSSTAPAMSIGIGLGVIGTVVGPAIPIILLLALLPILGIALAYSRLNQVERNCGNGYVWVGRSLGPWLGFQAGWVAVAGTTIFLAYGSQVCGAVILQFLNELGWTSVGALALDPTSTPVTTAVGLAVLLSVTLAAIRGADIAAALQRYLIIFEYLVLTGFCIYGIAAGTHPFEWAWLSPASIESPKVLAAGMVVAVYFYWGWDAAFCVTEETRNPRDASRGGYLALGLIAAMFTLAAIAFQRVLTPAEIVEQGPQGLTFYAGKLAEQPIAGLALLALLFSTVASLQAGVLPTARATLAMGRDQTLGKVWARLHPRYATPAAGTLLIMAAAALIAALSVTIGTLSTIVNAAVTSVGLLVSLYYGLGGLACAIRFRGDLKTSPAAALRSVLVPAVSALTLLGLGGYLAQQYWVQDADFAFDPANGKFLVAVPAGIIAIGLVISAWSKWVRRAPYFRGAAGTDSDAIVLAPSPLADGTSTAASL